MEYTRAEKSRDFICTKKWKGGSDIATAGQNFESIAASPIVLEGSSEDRIIMEVKKMRLFKSFEM